MNEYTVQAYLVDGSLTSPGFYHPVNLLTGIHSPEVEKLYDRPGVMKLRRIIWWRCKLLDNFSPHPSSWLLHSYHGAIPGVALHKKHHFVISHQHVVTTNIIEPSLH